MNRHDAQCVRRPIGDEFLNWQQPSRVPVVERSIQIEEDRFDHAFEGFGLSVNRPTVLSSGPSKSQIAIRIGGVMLSFIDQGHAQPESRCRWPRLPVPAWWPRLHGRTTAPTIPAAQAAL
jgi:hypothetical protein